MKKLFVTLPLIAAIGCATQAPTRGTPPVAVANAARDPDSISAVGDGDDYLLEWCGSSHAGKVFRFHFDRSETQYGGRLDSSGCVRYTFRNGIVKPGVNIQIQVDGRYVASETVPGNRGGSSGGRQTGGGGGNLQPQPQPQPQPEPQPLPRYDLESARNQADNNARCMANAVVAAYGRVEQYRFNFHAGFRQGISLYNLRNMGDVRLTPEYQMGVAAGQQAGGAAGVQQGQKDGEAAGYNAGRSEAHQRFVAVVDRGSAPNLDPSPSQPQVPAIAAQIADPRTVEEMLLAREDDVRSILQRQSFSYDGWRVPFEWDDDWSPLRLYGWQEFDFQTARSRYNFEWAWQMWNARRFQRCASQPAYYENISDPSKYSNAAQASSTFRNTWKSVYDRVIQDKWDDRVRERDDAARMEGQQLGQQVARQYAHNQGYSIGYRIAFSAGGAQGFNQAYGTSYAQGFQETANFLNNEVVIMDAILEIRPSSGRDAFAVGDTVDVVVKSAKNIGRQAGQGRVMLSGPALARTQIGTFEIGYSQSLREPAVLQRLATVSPTVDANASSEVVVSISGRDASPATTGQRFPLQVSWLYTLQGLAGTQPNSENRRVIEGYIIGQIKKEWERINDLGETNHYEVRAGRDDLLLKQLVRAFAQMDQSQKQAIVALVPRIREAFGSKPWITTPFKRAKWNSAAELISQLK